MTQDWGFPGGTMVKNPPANAEVGDGQGSLSMGSMESMQSMGSQRVRHD